MKLYTVHIHFRDETAKLGSVDARETEKLYVLKDYHFEKGFNKKEYRKAHLAADGIATTPEEAIRLSLSGLNRKITDLKKSIRAFERRKMAVELLVEGDQ